MVRRALRSLFLALSVLLVGPRLGFAAPPAEERSSVSTAVSSELATYADTDHVNVVSPSAAVTLHDPLAGWSAGGTYLVDIVSAASVDIVSTASPRWHEIRHAGSIHGEYKPYDVGFSAAGAVSSEPDYLSLSGGGGILFDLMHKNVTPRLDYTYTHDVAGRTGTPFSVYSLPLTRHSLGASLELILDRETLVTLNADAVFENGHQEKPYRWLPMFAPGVVVPAGASGDLVNALRLPGRVAENMPTTRQRFAFTGRLAQRLADTTFIIAERVYGDSWGMLATTTDLRIVLDFSPRVYFWPHFRANVQRGVSFWQLGYTATTAPDGSIVVPEFRTGDRELSPMLSGAVGAGLHWNVGSASDPSGVNLTFLLEGLGTHYSQTLFIDHRLGIFGATQLQVSF